MDLKDIKPSDMKGYTCSQHILKSEIYPSLPHFRADDDVVQQLNANFSAETKKLDNEEHM